MDGKLALIGGGFMGEAILSRLIAAGVVAPSTVSVGEPVAERRETLTRQYQVQAVADNRAAVTDAVVVLLAIKPQQTESVLASLRGNLGPDTLVVSIIAGTALSALTTALDHQQVVRAMPNTPAAVGEAMTVWTATPAVSAAQLATVRAIFRAIGREIQVDGDRYVDMATAVNGSGPGLRLPRDRSVDRRGGAARLGAPGRARVGRSDGARVGRAGARYRRAPGRVA